MKTASKLGPQHKRTEGRVPVWGYEFTTKAATIQGVHLNSCPAFVHVDLGLVLSRARVSIHDTLHCGAKAVVRGGAR